MGGVDLKDNPYVAPKVLDDETRVFRRGRLVFVPHGVDLPDVCVQCGQAAVRRQRKVFRVMPMWVRLVLVLAVWLLLSISEMLSLLFGAKWHGVLFVALLLCMVVAVLLRRKVVLHLAWCEGHFRRKRWAVAVVFLGLVSVFLGLVGLLLMFVGAVWHGFYDVYVSRVDRDYVCVRGTGRGFRESLGDDV